MAYGIGTLTGTYHKWDGTPEEGVIEIIPNSKTLIDGEGDVILSGRVEVTLDENGAFEVELPATDDTTVEPATGRQYAVVARLQQGYPDDVTGIELTDGQTLDMADVSSAPAAIPVHSAFEDLEDRVTALEAGGGGGGGGGVTDHGALTGLADDDHTQYHNNARGDARYTPLAHASSTSNPHSTTKTQVGLGNVDNTADTAKPVSTAQATAIAAVGTAAASDATTKANAAQAAAASDATTKANAAQAAAASDATTKANAAQAAAIQRSVHTGQQPASTISDLPAVLATRGIQAQTGTSYTLVLTDAGKFVTMTNGDASTLTVPPNSSVAFPVGTFIEGAQLGAGQVTLTEGVGVTINAIPGKKVAGQYGTFGLLKTATDTWLAYGRLSA